VAAAEISWAHRHQDVGFAGDYYWAVWRPGRAVLNGRHPYPPADSPSLVGAESNHPPTLFVALIPLSVPPFSVARVIWTLILACAVLVTLAAIQVRDPRCYALWIASAPVVACMMWGNLTLLMIAAAAVIWRWRDQPVRSGLVLGAAVAAKLLLAPLVVWFLFTGRRRSAAVAVTSAIVLLLLSWSAIRFDGLVEYPHLLQRSTELQVNRNLLVSGLVSQYGADPGWAIAAGQFVALVLLGIGWATRTNDRLSYCIALLAVMYATSIFHVFNLGFIVLMLALMYPVLSWPWLFVLPMWLVADIGPLADGLLRNVQATSIVTTLGVFAAVISRARRGRGGNAETVSR
jgi:hypothetical protein